MRQRPDFRTWQTHRHLHRIPAPGTEETALTTPHATPPPASSNIAEMGAALAALASTREDRYLLEAFADFLDVGTDAVWPLQLIILVEPLGGAQIVTVGHASPGLGYFRIDPDLELRLVLREELVFLDGDPRTGPPRKPRPEPDPAASPEPVPVNVRELGPRLWSIASSGAHQNCLEMFANALASTTLLAEALLLTVLVGPGGGAQIDMVTPASPGISVEIDDDLQVQVRSGPTR